MTSAPQPTAKKRTKEELDARWYEVLPILRAAQARGCKWTMPGQWTGGHHETIICSPDLTETEQKALQDYWDILLHNHYE